MDTLLLNNYMSPEMQCKIIIKLDFSKSSVPGMTTNITRLLEQNLLHKIEKAKGVRARIIR